DELRSLLPLGIERGVTARKAIGYAQALAELQGRMSRGDAIAETQQLTRTYARRQVGWFTRYRDATTIDADDDAARSTELGRLAALD
ncbi:MAG TPA: tRNA (adenosine(37)-N6)-dimethylallyltransferase MiaA, partial [Agromyces sp.]|nr:tRNA (adenosine(37)-N6)-dimethylallyltransferase MiaA [Agromyces sp.]